MDGMRKNRDSLEIFADILKVVSLHSSKTGILEAANLHFLYANIYLDIALRAGFLVLSDHKYIITEKGKDFLKKYLELTNYILEVKSSLEELKEEKKMLERALDKKIIEDVREVQIPIEKKEAPLVIKLSFERINPAEFYNELTDLGFTTEDALKIISWIDLIHKKDKFFFAGKKPSLIKACLACNGSVLLGAGKYPTRRVIRDYFKVSITSIQRSNKDYRKLILEENIDLTK